MVRSGTLDIEYVAEILDVSTAKHGVQIVYRLV